MLTLPLPISRTVQLSLFKFTLLSQKHDVGLWWGIFLGIQFPVYEKSMIRFALPRNSNTVKESGGGQSLRKTERRLVIDLEQSK